VKRTTPKAFQKAAIESGLAIFDECKRVLDVAGENDPARNLAVANHGALLIEAPTGAGKTLIAGHLAEKFSETERAVWFWFAPFKGVTGQTAASLRAELPGLRLRELTEDRNAADSRAGDVWVTTWQTVATRVKDRRNVHKPGEANLTVEELIDGLRAQGLRVGVVIDEAHHGFFGKGTATQAMEFYRRTLRPEYTVLVTATPDDADVARFEKELAVKLNRVTIGRSEPVEDGLIKEGIKCVAYMASPEQEALVDFEATALREGAAMHRAVKAELKKLGVSLTPLMLVQVDSTPDSVERAREQLLTLGFTAEQIAVHTADEPDASLLALANDEQREVLVFKMAVALGFDAPRAGILVSMRAARDEDFGVQLVGRILRVHRRLQGRARVKALPPLLRHGYVFLADAKVQEGLDLAGQRINKMQTEYATVSPTAAVVVLGGKPQVQMLGPGGQTFLLQLEAEPVVAGAGSTPATAATRVSFSNSDGGGGWSGTLVDLLGGFSAAPTTEGTPDAGSEKEKATPAILTSYRYKLRADVPRRFKTQVVSSNNEATEEDCAQRFIISSRDIVAALAAKVKVQAKEEEIFTQQIELRFVNAEMDPDQAARAANKILQRDEVFDPRELRFALLRKLAATLKEMGMDEAAADATKLRHMLNVILTAHPELLYEAQKQALAANVEIEEADEDLPEVLSCECPLPTSRLNVYRTLPPGLNSWERDFAALLDGDNAGVVKWWHRNPSRQPWSVQVVLANGHGFFPDFIVGVQGRKSELGALLADTKFAFEISQELPKTQADHPAYGRVLIVTRQGSARWMTVRYDEKQGKAVLNHEFRLADTAGY
jgi:superfamily II DNA or RNA helicase